MLLFRFSYHAAHPLWVTLIALICLVMAAYFWLTVSSPPVRAAADGEEQEGRPRIYLPLVADDQDGDDLEVGAEMSVGQEGTAPPVDADQAEAAQVEDAPRLFLSYIVNDLDVVAQGVDELPVDLTLNGGPYVGHEAIDDESGDVVASATGTAYYVDCKAGNDSNNGKSTSAAWKSVSRANQATLYPGDRLLFKRGCGWVGPLEVTWSGTANKFIVIGAYGSGDLPKIRDSYATNVRISGSYVVIENLHATLSTPPNPDPNCQNQPRGRKTGFGFTDSASYNILRNSKATNLSIGVSTAYKSDHNRIIYNTITDNHVVWTLTATSTSGATGILLHGNHHEIARNVFARNRPLCNYTGVLGGISIELYGASKANIHHNVIKGDRVFTEMGSSPHYVARDNVFAYNLHVSGYSSSDYGPRFVVTRGYGHAHGPVLGTKVYNNVVYFTGAGSKAVTCEKCGKDILTLKNNILWASQPFWSDVPFGESSNVYWDNDGAPALKWNGGSMHSASRIANPRFVNAPTGDFRLKSTSPAINRAVSDSLSSTYRRDLDKKAVPIAAAPDVGAYEYGP